MGESEGTSSDRRGQRGDGSERQACSALQVRSVWVGVQRRNLLRAGARARGEGRGGAKHRRDPVEFSSANFTLRQREGHRVQTADKMLFSTLYLMPRAAAKEGEGESDGRVEVCATHSSGDKHTKEHSQTPADVDAQRASCKRAVGMWGTAEGRWRWFWCLLEKKKGRGGGGGLHTPYK